MRSGSEKLRWLAVLSVFVLLVACGGGSGGGSGGPGNSPDISPALKYQGIMEQAVITENNAEDLSIGSYSGSSVGHTNLEASQRQSATLTTHGAVTPYRQKLLSAVRESARKIEFDSTRTENEYNAMEAAPGIVYGNCGGTLTVDILVDEYTGNIAGSFDYNSFCQDGVTLDGDGQVSGHMVRYTSSIELFRMDFSLISVQEPDISYDMSGWISVSFRSNGLEMDGMDILMQEVESGKVYWMRDYNIIYTPNGGYFDVAISGRYYDPEYGYVDVHTAASLKLDSVHPWPVQGTLAITGAEGSAVYIHFYAEGSCRLEADLDGEVGVDWTTNYWFSSPPGGNDGTTENPTDPDLFSLGWKFGIFGTKIGSSGLNAADIDADGMVEIIAGASTHGFAPNRFWYVVRRTTEDNYEQIWSSRFYDSEIIRILPMDTDGDGVYEIYVAMSDGEIIIYNGKTFTEMGTLSTGISLTDMTIGDSDGDGGMEIVCSDGSNLHIFAADTKQLRWSGTDWGGTSLAIGNVDSDVSPEIIVTSKYGPGYVLNGADNTLDWEYFHGFGRLVQTGNIDGDEYDKIVGAADDDLITIFDAEIKTPVNEIVTNMDIYALLVADTTGDQQAEIIHGNEWPGALHCHDGTTLSEVWSIDNPEQGMGDISLGDVDADGVVEVIWGAGNDSLAENHLFVADMQSQTIEWQSPHLDGPLSAVDMGDVDDDGQDEIVMVSFKSDSSHDGRIHIFDAVTHELEWRSSDLPGIYAYSGVNSVKIGDVDGDGATEFVLATANVHDGLVQVYDGTTHEMKYASTPNHDGLFSKLALEDVDNDGRIEIIAGQMESGGRLFVFNGTTAEEEWQSEFMTTSAAGVRDMSVADVDNDGNFEIIAVSANQVYAFDGATHQLDWLEPMTAKALAVHDIDADGVLEILIGKATGVVEVYDGTTFTLEDTLSPSGQLAMNALLVDDVNQDGEPEILIGGDNGLRVYDVRTGGLFWQMDGLGPDLGRYNHIVSRDIDGDGKKEVVIGSKMALYQFE